MSTEPDRDPAVWRSPVPSPQDPLVRSAVDLELRNYTPHDLHLHRGDGTVIHLASLGIARCTEDVTHDGHWDTAELLPRVRVGYGSVTGLPGPEPGVLYLVSQLVVRALPRRSDLAYPHGEIRDTEGRITGFRDLAVPADPRPEPPPRPPWRLEEA